MTAPQIPPPLSDDGGWPAEYGESRYSLSSHDVSADEWDLYAGIVIARADDHPRGATAREWWGRLAFSACANVAIVVLVVLAVREVVR